MKITFIGSGNVAWHLSQGLELAGNTIYEVYSLHIANAQQLATKLYNATATTELNFADSYAQLFILAIPDDAIPTVLEQLILPENAILVHTSGSFSLQELEKLVAIHSDIPVQTGVLYPLQTFSKQRKIQIEKTPICIEASDESTEEVLVALSQSLSEVVYVVSSEERKILHLAAVFACNFTNHLWAISQNILTEQGLGLELLHPLIIETTEKALTTPHPADVQTGPARRGDLHTIRKHLTLLENQPTASKIYRIISESIENTYEDFDAQSL